MRETCGRCPKLPTELGALGGEEPGEEPGKAEGRYLVLVITRYQLRSEDAPTVMNEVNPRGRKTIVCLEDSDYPGCEWCLEGLSRADPTNTPPSHHRLNVGVVVSITAHEPRIPDNGITILDENLDKVVALSIQELHQLVFLSHVDSSRNRRWTRQKMPCGRQ